MRLAHTPTSARPLTGSTLQLRPVLHRHLTYTCLEPHAHSQANVPSSRAAAHTRLIKRSLRCNSSTLRNHNFRYLQSKVPGSTGSSSYIWAPRFSASARCCPPSPPEAEALLASWLGSGASAMSTYSNLGHCLSAGPYCRWCASSTCTIVLSGSHFP